MSIVLQLTDTHLLKDSAARAWDMDPQASLTKVLAAMSAYAPQAEALLLTGDLAQEPHAEVYARLRDQCAALQLPMLALPGNHDDPALLRAAFGHWWTHQLADNWLLIGLNSHVAAATHGQLSATTLAKLAETLDAYPRQHILCCVHHHPLAMGSSWIDAIMLRNADALLAVLSRHPQARHLLCGHVHQARDIRQQGFRLLSTPSTNRQFHPRHPSFALDYAAPGFRLLELQADGSVNSRVRRIAIRQPRHGQSTHTLTPAHLA